MPVQFDGIGDHGTKIIVYNLWHNDDGNMELDFSSDPKVSFVLYSLLTFLFHDVLYFEE
jgi:hypothetical protein